MPQVLIKDIRLPISESEETAIQIAKKRLSDSIGINDALGFSIYKQSVDARRRKNITAVYSVSAELGFTPDSDTLERAGFTLLADSKVEPRLGTEPLSARPIVCGFGPAGMFAALILAEHGYRPLVIERGDDTEDRVNAVRKFCETGILDTESNIQFGAGGAGTFSDGKLVTRINDSKCRYVLEQFVALGAPKEVVLKAKPHVGTDVLRTVVSRMRDKIKALGGEIRFRCALKSFKCDSDGKIISVNTSKGELPCGALILATGHSARDVYTLLRSDDCDITEKPFSVGVRIEHLRKDIDLALYGDRNLAKRLGSAEYACSYRADGRGVYTFCMCPGGEVVAAASEEGGVVVNGMSEHARNGRNSNSAIAVSVTPEDCHAFGGTMEFQRLLERRAFLLGGSDYSAPIQTVGDFLAGKHGSEPTNVTPTYMNGSGRVKLADLSTVFPEYINTMLRTGIKKFSSSVGGFSSPDALLTGVETRTSAPYRILRSDTQGTFIGVSARHTNLYPCGEGAGYAGGITSAAVDGIKQACAVIERYAPLSN